MKLRSVNTVLLGLFLVGCGGSDSETEEFISNLTLSEEVIDVNEKMASVTFKGGKTLKLEAGVGSGAFHAEDDPADEIYTITDRGPNFSCSSSESYLEVKNFCVGENGSKGRIFAMADFTPTIYKFNIDTSGVFGAKVGYEVMQTIKIKDRDGDPISGLPNPIASTERAYDNQGKLLDFDPEGIDPESIIRLSNGNFWIAEEYAPSLVHVAKDGRILERIVPEGMASKLSEANYRVTDGLPGILAKRQLNRGIKSLVITPDEDYLYFAVQNPLANPDFKAYSTSRHVRIFKVLLQQFGDFSSMVAEYVYILDKPESFTFDNSNRQNDVKITDMVVLDDDKLVLIERVNRHTKLYQVVTNATNILGSGWDIATTDLSLENLPNLTAYGITPVTKKLVFDSRNELSDLSPKIEGLAVLNDQYVVFTNDNDFGVSGVKAKLTVVRIAEQLSK
ncbi:esterase-like activity of phytase family protein [Candidatus Halobeggiatoa sp. HSG11]|nr:esterase-like activity of phytase family protein [Candidatus Halobeggiatoa sp. HSG11]